MPTSDRKINLAGIVLNGNRHLCAFFHSEDEEFRTLLPFIGDGLALGEKVAYLVNINDREEHRRRLRDGGIDVEAVEQSGQLEVIGWPPSVRNRGAFDQDQALKMVDHLLDAARNQGYQRTRIVGDMDWASENEIRDLDLIALEARLGIIYSRHNAWVICAYDLSRFGGALVLDVMRTHPAALIGRVLQHNPFYIRPEQMLEELRTRGEIESVTGS
jgi:hypothetical protein